MMVKQQSRAQAQSAPPKPNDLWGSISIPYTYLYGVKVMAEKEGRSYGQQLIYYLKKAGCPQYTFERFKQIMERLENESLAEAGAH